jgi:hypothetical protein
MSAMSAVDTATPPALKEIPPLLRRRASLMGRAALQALSRPEIPYAGQSVILASRFGEFSRSLALLRELAQEGKVSPQHFSMAVHNANGGLFMMAQQAKAPLTALAAAEETALAGLLEAQIQIAERDEAVWLVFAEEPLPADYRALASPSELSATACWFACLLELAPGTEFALFPEATPSPETPPDMPPAAPLDLLRFFLTRTSSRLCLSARGGWTLARTGN